MALIKSISGIRGTIGGKPGDNLTPLDIVKFTAAFGAWLKHKNGNNKIKMVVGRDARISGPMASQLVNGTLMGLGIEVIDTGLATTPTVEMAVVEAKAQGGIILTASHNPAQWNALKLLNHKGEFITAEDGAEVLEMAENDKYAFALAHELGSMVTDGSFNQFHIDRVVEMQYVDVQSIRSRNYTVVIDCVNSVGGIVIPRLLEKLGAAKVVELYCEPDGNFPHNPEPLPENLGAIAEAVKLHKADVGFVVDPDVDRLAIVCEDGTMFGEEYTLVAVADYILSLKPGNTVSNLSSTRALQDITEKHGGKYFASAVGEVNVVEKMKSCNAVIGGEGNGGVIFPGLHYGRDALAGIALFLSHLSKSGLKCSELRKQYPDYFMSKNKIELDSPSKVDEILNQVKQSYKGYKIDSTDGVKIDFGNEWAHLRKSNTEPIIRVYTESVSPEKAQSLAGEIVNSIKALL